MSSTYAKGTRVWLPDSATGWVPGTVSSLTLPSDKAPTGRVTLVVTFDGDDTQSKTLTFPLSALDGAGNSIQPTAAPPPGQDALPPLRNPPLLESSEDLASLSNLNEPSGEWEASNGIDCND